MTANPIKPQPSRCGDGVGMGTARIETVNVVHRVGQGYYRPTAIDKRPVTGPVEAHPGGLVGDQQRGSSHGGPDKAVYAYATEDADWWAAQLGRDIPPGTFGENLRTKRVDVCGALIGERWQVGGVLLEVRMPRTPCENLSLRMGLDGFHLRFNATGRVGALLKVLVPGPVRAGDEVIVEHRPDHAVTVTDLAVGVDAEGMRRLLDSGAPLARTVRAKARRVVRRATAGQ